MPRRAGARAGQAATSTATSCTTGSGTRDSVRRLQYRLNHVKGIGANVPVTGYFGPQTARKVKKYLDKIGHHKRANRPLNKQNLGRGEMNRLFGPHYKTHG